MVGGLQHYEMFHETEIVRYIGDGTTQAGQVLAGPLSGRFLLFRVNQKLIPPIKNILIICIVV